MSDEFGVTEKGFKKKTYQDIVESLEEKAKSYFGEDVNVSSSSVNGWFIRLFAFSLSLIWSVAEKVYNSAYVILAEDQSLDYAVSNLNVKRKGKRKSEVSLTVIGTPGTEIDKGWTVETETDSSIKFETKYNTTIQSNGETEVQLIAKEAGEKGNVPANTITVITQPISGIDSITNPVAADFGRDRETNHELRNRYFNQLGQNSSDVIAAITAAVSNINEVRQVKVFENDTEQTNSLGMPMKSVFAVVLGGYEEDIAQAIYTAKAGGIRAYGDIITDVYDEGGTVHKIGFSRPTDVDTYYTIDLTTNDDYPVDGDDLITEVIVYYLDELIIADDIIHSKITQKIHGACSGIVDFELYIGTAASPTTKDNIEISGLEVAITDPTKVVINHGF